MTTISIIFWICIAIVFYTYIGYGILLYLAVHIKRILCGKKTDKESSIDKDGLPHVTMMVCAFNEQDIITAKMENFHRLDYPKDKMDIIWVTDGSNDDTNNILAGYDDVEIVFTPERKGKTAAIKHGMKKVSTSIVILSDANSMLNKGAVKEIVRLMDDPKVGCVAGEKRVAARNDSQMAAQSEGLYWKYESTLKRLDSELYSAMGAAGELCAIRKELFEDMPDDTLLDDFIMSMITVRKGYRIAYSSDAYAMEYGSANMEEESKRKKRIAAGGLQSCWRLRGMMNPFRQPVVAFQFISHRVLRWSITPIALFALVPLNVILVMSGEGWTYTLIWILQLAFYAAATRGYYINKRGESSRIFNVPYYFLFMNANVIMGFGYLMRKKNGTWEKSKRG